MDWKAAREAVDAIGTDGMSGEKTDGDTSGWQKQLARVLVWWINSEVTHLFHHMDSWKSVVADEGFVSTCRNRPFIQLSTAKDPVKWNIIKGLSWNWFNDTWDRSLPDPRRPYWTWHPFPTLVGSILWLCIPHPYWIDSPATMSTINEQSLVPPVHIRLAVCLFI